MNALTKKLQIKPGTSWLFFNVPHNFAEIIPELPEGTVAAYTPDGMYNGVLLFVTDSPGLVKNLEVINPVLNPETVCWIIYPKKNTAIKTDLEMTGSWDALKKYNLRPVASAAVNDTWTAIRVKQENLAKVSEFRNEAVKKNEYGAFIDLENRRIILPNDAEQVLAKAPAAMAFYQTLSFTNKKEYVVWILSAKQEKTRTERIVKLEEKLLAHKKNPSEK